MQNIPTIKVVDISKTISFHTARHFFLGKNENSLREYSPKILDFDKSYCSKN